MLRVGGLGRSTYFAVVVYDGVIYGLELSREARQSSRYVKSPSTVLNLTCDVRISREADRASHDGRGYGRVL